MRATEDEEARLRSRLASVLRPARSAGGPLVSIVIPTRDGLEHLRRLLPALDQLVYRDVEIVVVDNGSRDGTGEWLVANRPAFPTRVIANAENRSYAEANNQGVAAATGELILLLNNDTEPAGLHVLGHLVDRVVEDPTVVAVGSRLIYPRRSGPAMGPMSAAADLSLQHRAVAFATVDGTQRAVHVGRGEDPLGHDASERREIEMATAACLLVRRTAFEAVGGFSGGYDYGMEDVDLALKLREAGGRLMYEPQATFWHYESATQAIEARESRASRQAANRALLQDRWGPRIARESFLDRLAAARSWAKGPLHVGITLTRDDEQGGWGDWYTAHELGEALEAIGWRVSLPRTLEGPLVRARPLDRRRRLAARRVRRAATSFRRCHRRVGPQLDRALDRTAVVRGLRHRPRLEPAIEGADRRGERARCRADAACHEPGPVPG